MPIRVICSGFVFDKEAETVIRQLAPKRFELTFAQRAEDVSPAMPGFADVLLTVAATTDDMMRAAPRLRLSATGSPFHSRAVARSFVRVIGGED